MQNGLCEGCMGTVDIISFRSCNSYGLSQNHKIIESFGLDETCKGHLVQAPCNKQGHLQQDQVAQSPIQPDLEWFHADSTNSLGNLFQCFTLIIKNFFLICSLNLPSFSLKPSSLVLSLQGFAKSLSAPFLQAPKILNGCNKVSPEPSLLQAEQP